MAAAVSLVVAVEAFTRWSACAKRSEMQRIEGKSGFLPRHDRDFRTSGQGHPAGG